jgi:hypothetical protein
MKFLLPVLAGVAALLLAAVISGVIILIISKFFPDFPSFWPRSGTDKFIIQIIFFFWVFVSTLTGGFTCTVFSEVKDDFNLFMTICISFLILYIFTNGKLLTDATTETLIFVAFFLGGFIIGGLFGVKYKQKKDKLKLD